MRWRILAGALFGLALVSSGALIAQDGDKIYLQEEPERDEGDYAIGFSFGLVELGDNVIEGQQIVEDDDVETYLTVSLRIPIGDRNAHRSGGNAGGFQGYLEPEVAFWDGTVQSDTLVGLNVVGAMPLNAVEFFVGGGLGLHFLDTDEQFVINDGSDEAVGINAHFGVDVSLSRKVSLFGVGRFDLVDDDRDELEGKASLGLRFRF